MLSSIQIEVLKPHSIFDPLHKTQHLDQPLTSNEQFLLEFILIDTKSYKNNLETYEFLSRKGYNFNWELVPKKFHMKL